MSLTDATYFQGELNLPDTDQQAGQEQLQLYIDKYEPDYLKLLLGDVLYGQFVAGLAADPVDPIWTNLKNVIFVQSGTAKISPCANYIYFYYVRRKTYSNSGTGLTQSTNENSTIIDSKIETSRAWCEMNKLSFNVYRYLKANVTVYGPLPYDLRFYNLDYLYLWYDWAYWWSWFPIMYRRMIPEIYLPINAHGIF